VLERPVSVDNAVRSNPPCEAEVRTQLERILTSPHLQASERRRAFLRFVVEETLAGRANTLKGYTVAIAVFRRDETFDSQSDPVVRLEARRLRRDLDCYYVDAGSRDPVRISIPKGSYVPHFERSATAPGLSGNATDRDAPVEQDDPDVDDGPTEQHRPQESHPADSGPGLGAKTASVIVANRRVLEVAALILTIAVTSLVSWSVMRPEAPVPDTGGPAIAVLPFEPRDATEDSRYLAAGIGEELIGDLMRFPGFRLYTSAIGNAETRDATAAELSERLGISYIVQGSVRRDDEDIRVTARLFDAASGRVLWSQEYDRPYTPEALMGMETDIAGEIATALGQPYGIVNTDLSRRLATSPSAMPSYICVQRAYHYRRTFLRADFEPVLSCLEETVKRDPGYSDAWAMLGWLHLDAGRFEFFRPEALDEQYDRALEAASRAVSLAPDNTTALKALASIHHYRGDYDKGEQMARRAVDLNPHDPDALVQLGWRLAICGRFDEGIPLVQRAIDRTANPPGWYFHTLAIDRYLKGNYDEAMRLALRSARGGGPASPALVAIAAAAVGDRDATRTALEEMSRFPRMHRDPAGYFRRHGASDEIVSAIVAGLAQADKIASR